MAVKVIKGPLFEKVVRDAQVFIGKRALEEYSSVKEGEGNPTAGKVAGG